MTNVNDAPATGDLVSRQQVEAMIEEALAPVSTRVNALEDGMKIGEDKHQSYDTSITTLISTTTSLDSRVEALYSMIAGKLGIDAAIPKPDKTTNVVSIDEMEIISDSRIQGGDKRKRVYQYTLITDE